MALTLLASCGNLNSADRAGIAQANAAIIAPPDFPTNCLAGAYANLREGMDAREAVAVLILALNKANGIISSCASWYDVAVLGPYLETKNK